MGSNRALRKWEVDDNTVVETSPLKDRKIAILINGSKIPGQLQLKKKNSLRFDFPDGRNGSVAILPQFGGASEIDLRVNGVLMVETGKTPLHCKACREIVKPNDRFCGHCGGALLTGAHHKHMQRLKTATNTIWMIAALFVASGVIFFFIQRSTMTTALHRLDGLSPNAIYPVAVNGVKYTVGTLRQKVVAETWSILAVNLILAAVMGGLALWSRRAPLAAVLTAAATYAVVVVTNGLINPLTLVQGLYIKIIVIAALANGIKSAFAIRAERS